VYLVRDEIKLKKGEKEKEKGFLATRTETSAETQEKRLGFDGKM